MIDTSKEERMLYFADKVMDICKRKDLKKFDGFYPIDPEIYDNPDDDGFFIDCTTDLLSAQVDVAIYTPGLSDGETSAKREDQLCRLKKLDHKEFRKLTGAFVPRPYRIEVAFANRKYTTDGFLQEVNNKFKYVEIGGYKTTPATKSWALYMAQVLLGVQFNLENQCYVYLKPDDAEIGFKYPIFDLQQLKELFSLRDIPDGYKRRAALRHWVAQHTRRKTKNPDELIAVKKYLRGKQDFKWFGISGSIIVNT